MGVAASIVSGKFRVDSKLVSRLVQYPIFRGRHSLEARKYLSSKHALYQIRVLVAR